MVLRVFTLVLLFGRVDVEQHPAFPQEMQRFPTRSCSSSSFPPWLCCGSLCVLSRNEPACWGRSVPPQVPGGGVTVPPGRKTERNGTFYYLSGRFYPKRRV